ncbi:hypothetical protein [Variovorax sp. YR752]|uniref:hypothetical protein n=1 Tax=Variovorax sp. YR752 TaxID=1884383 RepID=UPI003137FE3B
MTAAHSLLAPAKAARARRIFIGFTAAWSAALLPLGNAHAATTPSQTPLYNAVPGAKPNLMFVLDNSGSMDLEAQDGYAVDDKCKVDGEKDCGNKNGGYGWYAMRSSSVNTQYYNPAIRYLARVNPDGTEKGNSIPFVDNQSSTYKRPIHDTDAGYQRKFIYVQCKSNDCSEPANRTVVTINDPPGTGTIDLPIGNKRTDCGTNVTKCTAVLEHRNIVNWYEWYSTRSLAVSTALGLAMQSYDNKFRVGYVQYNRDGKAAEKIISGVNYFKDDVSIAGRKWKTRFYDWIYGLEPNGGTPSHHALVLAANYYAGSGTTAYTASWLTSPWKNDPNDLTSGELSCRRAYAIVLSDGAWNPGTTEGTDTRYTASTGSINFDGKPSGNTARFQYDPKGAPGYDSPALAQKLSARNRYVPYPGGGGSNGFADLTARYFWHTDFSSTLANDVPTMEGQHNPTFWQNMTTFTIGWGLTPSGEGKGSGLNWSQIEKYNSDWLAGNPAAPPQWATGNLNSGSAGSDDARRVDDFIHAGFTGGGRAYSVYSGDDVRRALDNALSSMAGSGNDAGVAVSGNSNEFQTLEGQYKYTTEYQTADNSGDIKAFELNADGGDKFVEAGKPKPVWSANAKMPPANERTIFGLSTYDTNMLGSGLRTVLTYNTRLDKLPPDFQALLNADKRQATDESFVRYLLGDNAQKDVGGTVYRLRKQPIGASVNSPPIFVGGASIWAMAPPAWSTARASTMPTTRRSRPRSLPPSLQPQTMAWSMC